MITLALIMVLNIFTPSNTIYDYSFKTINGEDKSLADFKGKKILVVNTASKCGFTKQYKDLQKLHEMYGEQLVIIGFPANNFGSQEPGSNEDISTFCEENYGVTFLMAEKVDVKGDKINPLFKFLTTQDNPDFSGDIKWNFEKFLINEDGKLMHRYRSQVSPLDPIITAQL
ncbi:glutathione peroxidase [Sphingobacterium rhinopitheci]|mgnify:CR=1 FL=1|uniref:glutathione peroxidase n=1 Tax=Sphingobacterium rhinopitheci TaxID=2781960 RepID=UPI001F51F31B|nr:glutathione peroxidase [Sphingobacterium rhinopitheci]MCI0920162.1 glutathione peroxidase [Sphingobacterium rhinopitheci]